jgi:hypothetical protein
MKYALAMFAAFAAGFLYMTLSGCSTDEPGATDTLGTYTVNVDASPDKVTDAANKACQDLKLSNINANGSKVDGKVTGLTAQGQDVSIDIKQSGEDVSQVSIRVGATGDQAISKQLVDRIKAHLSWF